MRDTRKRAVRGGTGGKREKTSPQEITAKYKVNHSIELLEFLLLKCNTSRNNVKNLLTTRRVLVNGSAVTQYNFMLAKDDEIKISKNPAPVGMVKKVEQTRGKREKSVAVSVSPPKIIYEDEDFIAVDKPAGLLSVESDRETECAFAYVLRYLQQRDKRERPFILHRIDKETSGVLVFAKNVKIHSMLRLNWNDFVKTRAYYAVVEGVPEPKEDTVVSYLKENKNNLVYSTHDPSGQKAITHYTVLKEMPLYSLLSVHIDTGRKNQIRVHMQEIGHPVVGDEKYGYTKNPLHRLGLHASKLEFIHPITKKLISVSSPMPVSFKNLFGGGEK